MLILNSHKALPFQLSFLVFSMLLNCMGIVILKFSSEQVGYNGLGILEAFKDLPIALTSLFAANYLGKFGHKKALSTAMVVVAACCILLPMFEGLWFFRLWFVLIGISFAIAKMSVFALIRSNMISESQLARTMSLVEASFMIGIFCVNIGFGWLLSSRWADFWKFGFWFITLLALATFFLLKKMDFQEVPEQASAKIADLGSVFTRLTIPFFIVIFLIVFTEQGFNSWLPTFYRNHLGANSFFALQSSAFMALFSFTGRSLTGKLITKFDWLKYLIFCLSILIVILLISQFLLLNDTLRPLLFWLFPVVGLFLSPLYPLFNSKFLLSAGKDQTDRLVSVIMIFSSLGSSIGSISCSYLFYFGVSRFYPIYSFIPILIIVLILMLFIKNYTQKHVK